MLKRQIQKIASEGEVAPPHCHVILYQTIDELERVINSLQESYLDVCFGGETEPDLSWENEGVKDE